MPTYFLADPHFGHNNIRKFCGRPHATVEDMDNAIIHNINAIVKEADVLWCLGDWSFHTPQKYRGRLACQTIHLIRGNHDCPDEAELKRSFNTVQELTRISVDGQKIVLCHYPMFHWDASHKGAWHLYGHVHGRLQSKPFTLACDVGVDVWNFMPVSMHQLRIYFKGKKVPCPGEEVPDHQEGYSRVKGNDYLRTES